MQNANLTALLSTLVPRMYAERASFGEAGILETTTMANGTVAFRCTPAPLDQTLFPAFALYLWWLWDDLFSADRQLPFDDLARETRLLALLGWEAGQVSPWLEWMVGAGLLQLDRYTGAPVLMRLVETKTLVAGLYGELV